MESKRMKMMEEEEDRISGLQDCLIQHIISFLPSTKQAIQTGILSKRWRNQWTRVPVLIFVDDNGMYSEKFHKLVDNALILHDCYKIKKFHLDYFYIEKDDQFTSKIRYATRKHVEDLNLSSAGHRYMLPEFLFNCASLVKLRTENCHFMPRVKVNWGFLTELNLYFCNLTDHALERIICGSPLLESLKLYYCDYPSGKLVIASKSMKKLVLQDLHIMEIKVFEISCPNLEELSLEDIAINDPKVFGQAIENVLLGCSFLKSLDLVYCREFQQLVIASKSLKRLNLGRLDFILHMEISCPKLEVLDISDFFRIETMKLLDLPALVYASIDFYNDRERLRSTEKYGGLIKDILQQLHHAKEVSLGDWFLEILSAIEVAGLFSPELNVRRLTLDDPDLNVHHFGIACLLRNSHKLEELVIKFSPYGQLHGDLPKNDFWENYWKSNVHGYDCLRSHLKTIHIIGYPNREDRHKFVLNFVQFLLKNARVLEKMVLEWQDHELESFSFEASRELLSLPRCSQHAKIELIWSNK